VFCGATLSQPNSVLHAFGVGHGDGLIAVDGDGFRSGEGFVELTRRKPNMVLQVVNLPKAPFNTACVEVCDSSRLRCVLLSFAADNLRFPLGREGRNLASPCA